MPDIFDSSSLNKTDESSGDSSSAESATPASKPKNHTSMNDHTHPETVKHPHRHVDEYSETMRNEPANGNPLNSFIPKPIGMRFDSQGGDEHIVLLLRRHPITQLGWISIAIVLAVFPILLSMIGFLAFLPMTYKFALTVSWYLLLSGYILESFLKWFFNLYILTDERVIDIDFLSLIYKNESSAKIDNIEDVTATTGGVLKSVVNFGTVKIQTAAAKVEFEFDDVPQPSKIVRLINELILEEEREKLEGRVT